MQVQYSLLDAPAGQAHGARPRPRTASRCSATARSPAASSATDGWACPSRPEPLENRSLIKYKLIIDDFGGWDLFQALLETLRRHRRPPRQRHRDGGKCGDAHAAGASRRSSSARATARTRLQPGDFQRRADAKRITPEIDAVLARGQRARRRRLQAGARPQRPPRLDHEIQSQQGSRLTVARAQRPETPARHR